MQSTKYRYLKSGENVLSSDEIRLGDKWVVAGESCLLDKNTGVSELAEREMWYRRRLPHSGNTQFLMTVSIMVPVIVNCDGKEQEMIEAEAGELAYQKVLDDPRKYINYESVDWGDCKVDDIQPEPKNPGKYRILEVGEIVEAGDQHTHGNDWIEFHEAHIGSFVVEFPNFARRPINEPKYPSGCEPENGYGESKDGGLTGFWMVFNNGNDDHPRFRIERIDEPADHEPLESDKIAWELAKLAGYDLDINGYVCEFPTTKP